MLGSRSVNDGRPARIFAEGLLGEMAARGDRGDHEARRRETPRAACCCNRSQEGISPAYGLAKLRNWVALPKLRLAGEPVASRA